MRTKKPKKGTANTEEYYLADTEEYYLANAEKYF